MALKKITHVATGKVVNLYTSSSTGAVANGTRLSLYSWQDNNDQKWQEERRSNKTSLMRLARDTTKVMNRHSGNNNAHVWTYDGSTDTDNDSLIDTRTIGFNTRICLVNRELYLTKGASDNFLYWNPKLESDRQYFKIEDADANTGGNTGDDTKGNYLIYPTKVMNISQGYNDNYSHQGCSTGSPADYPIDESCEDSGRSYMYCPCDEMVVRRIYGVGSTGTNTIWLESLSPVIMPYGKDYITMMVIHPNDDPLQNLSVGQRFTRKQAMFKEGNDGNATGYHFHISIGTGKFTGTGWVKNNKGSYVLATVNANRKL